MPIGVQQFRPLGDQEANPLHGLVAEFLRSKMGMEEHRANQKSAQQKAQREELERGILEQEAPFKGKMAEQDYLAKELSNQRKQKLLPYAEQEAQESLRGKKLSNWQQELTNQFLPQEKELNIEKLKKSLQDNPELSDKLTGLAAEREGIEAIGRRYGKDNKIYTDLVDAWQLERDNVKSQINNRDAYAGSLDQRIATPVTKLRNELKKVNQGIDPITGEQLSPEEQRARRNELTKELENQTTRQSVLDEYEGWKGVQELTKDIDVNSLKEFSGFYGRSKAWWQKHLGDKGFTQSKEYIKFNTFKNSTANIIKDALRQNFGTSVVTGYIKENLAPVIDTTARETSSPQEVEATINWFNDFVKNKVERSEKVAREGYGTQGYGTSSSSSEEDKNISNAHDPAGIL